MNKNDHVHRIKVGLFLVAAAAVMTTMLFMIGGAQHPFARKVLLHTELRDTTGLAVGAPVLLGGLEVGDVKEIQFGTALAVKDVSVTLAIESRYLERIRGDSRAMLTAKGLLGDSTIAITVGSATTAPLADGAFIPAKNTQTMIEMVSSLNGGIDEVRALSRGLRDRLNAVVTPEIARDLGRFVHAAADSAEAVAQGDGLAHALIHDRQLSVAARSLARNVNRAAGDLASTIGRIDRIAATLEGGNGTPPILADAQRAVHELAAAATAIRLSPGLLHTLVYGPEGDELVGNLTALSRTLKRVGEDLAAGKGTMGALLEDPSVYEDLKIILGDVKRNTLLKALVRFTVQRDRLHQDAGPAAH